MTQSTLLSENEAPLTTDYKHFIRSFETYRQDNPHLSFQQAMDAFLAAHKRQPTV